MSDPLNLAELEALAAEVRSFYTVPSSGEWPDGLVDEELAVKSMHDALVALLARVEEAEERIAVTLEWLEENRPVRCGYASPDDYDDSESLIRMLTKGADE